MPLPTRGPAPGAPRAQSSARGGRGFSLGTRTGECSTDRVLAILPHGRPCAGRCHCVRAACGAEAGAPAERRAAGWKVPGAPAAREAGGRALSGREPGGAGRWLRWGRREAIPRELARNEHTYAYGATCVDTVRYSRANSGRKQTCRHADRQRWIHTAGRADGRCTMHTLVDKIRCGHSCAFFPSSHNAFFLT